MSNEKKKAELQTQVQIVAHMLRGAQYIAAAVDRGFSSDMLSSSQLQFIVDAAIDYMNVYSDVLDDATVHRRLHDMEAAGRISSKTAIAFEAAYEAVRDKAAQFNEMGLRMSEFAALIDDYMNSLRHKELSEGLADLLDNSEGDFATIRDKTLALVSELDNLADGRPPEGDILSDEAIKESVIQFKRAKEDPNATLGVQTGIDKWDEVIHGFRRTEAWMIAGYVGEGKTMTCLQIAYSASIEQGKNVVFISTEMGKDQLRDLIYARHSLTVNKENQIANDGDLGFEHEDLELGRLEGDKLKLYKSTVEDFSVGRKTGRYGQVYIVGTTMSDNIQTLRVKCQALRQHFPIDLIIIDYATLLAPRRRRNQRHEEMAEIMRDCKALAFNFNNGEGVPVLTAHQISRQGRDSAGKRGYYTLNDLAETSGAERNMDGVLWVLRDEDNKERNTAWLGCAKNRRGYPPDRFEVRVNYAYAAFHSAQYTEESDNIDDDFREDD